MSTSPLAQSNISTNFSNFSYNSCNNSGNINKFLLRLRLLMLPLVWVANPSQPNGGGAFSFVPASNPGSRRPPVQPQGFSGIGGMGGGSVRRIT
jgi:hypothetical protein